MRRLLIILAVAVIATAAVSANASTPPGGGVHCGTERWAVKTLSDPLANTVNLKPIMTTVQALGKIPRPTNIGTTRLSSETRTYTVRAVMIGVRTESDHDYHLILRDRTNGALLIAESPAPDCDGTRSSTYYSQMANAHAAVRAIPTGSTVTVTGVLFWDYPHGQTGRAPNTVELHPLLAIHT